MQYIEGSPEWFNKEATNVEMIEFRNKIEALRAEFIDKYSPEKLREMNGEHLLMEVFSDGGMIQNMMYDHTSRMFGAPGEYKYLGIVYYSEEDTSWRYKEKSRAVSISHSEASKMAENVRDKLLECITIIENHEINTINDYEDLDGKLSHVFFYKYPWTLKYYQMLFPQFFPGMYADVGRCHRYGQKNDVVVFNLLNTQNVADKRVYEILSQKFELFKGVFGASDRAIGLLESGSDFEKRVSLIYQQCKTSNDFTKEFSTLEKELDRKRNKKMEQLKAVIIKEAPEQHKEEFERILSEIKDFQDQEKYWSDISTKHTQVSYPKYYELKREITIPGIEHGYLLIGGYYKNDKLISSIFQISDTDGKIYAAKNELIKTLMQLVED